MRRILLRCRSVSWVAFTVRLVLVGALAGCSLGTAQVIFCGSPEKFKVINGECPDPFDKPEASPPPRHSGAPSSTITFQELRHVAPKKAQKEKENAEKALARNRQEEAVGHLKNAIRIDPEFVLVRNDLAVLYMGMNNPYPAIEQLNEAIKLDPHSPLLFGNLAICYITVKKLEDAERAAHMAVNLDRTGTRVLYILGSVLYYQRKFTEEALRCAERVRDEYPMAHLFAARIFIDRNEFEQARGEIRAYLSGSGQDPDLVPYATGWLDFIAAQEQQKLPQRFLENTRMAEAEPKLN
jgi:tetratricopeptide (TPR) repeat protein